MCVCVCVCVYTCINVAVCVCLFASVFLCRCILACVCVCGHDCIRACGVSGLQGQWKDPRLKWSCLTVRTAPSWSDTGLKRALSTPSASSMYFTTSWLNPSIHPPVCHCMYHGKMGRIHSSTLFLRTLNIYTYVYKHAPP